MSIIYHHSLELLELAHVLQKTIHNEQTKSPLRPPLVVIPNMNIERWLKIHLPILSPAKISLNIRYVFLEKILEELTRPKQNLESEAIYAHAEVEKLIFQYLLDHKNDPNFQFLGNYLDSPNRVFYFSNKLANYFKDYELNRSYWISDWAKESNIDLPNLTSKSTVSSQLAKNEYYQLEKKIYSDLFFNSKENRSSLSQYLIRSLSETFDWKDLSIHLFCLANLSDTYLHVLCHLSSQANLDVHFYQFHSGDKTIHINQRDTSPVRWSYPQTFLAQTLSKFTEILPTNNSINSEKRVLPKGLAALRNLLTGSEISPFSTLGEYGATKDASIRIWNAPSAYREVEAVANDILYKMNQNKQKSGNLTLLDFSILVTDIKSYRAAIEWVFDGGIMLEVTKNNNQNVERQRIPYSLVDLKASDASPLYRTLDNFWELCHSSGFKFSQFQKLLRSPLLNPYLMEDESALQDFELLLNNLGIAYEDMENETENDPFQISTGIRRAVLSSVLSNEAASSDYKIAPIQTQNDSTIVQLTEIWVRILDARNQVSTFLKKGVWDTSNLNMLRSALESLFQIDLDELETRSQFHIFWSQLFSWKDIILNETDGLEILKLITFHAFDGISVKKGDYLTGGVTISLLQPMRPLPFKHVYVLGLGEGKFPGSNDNSRLNLRNLSPEDWDLNKRQIQESLLWESFFSAHESLTLSYVGKNTKEDKVFEPCSSLYEIMQGLGIAKATEIPLVSYSRSYDHDEVAIKAGLVSYDYARSWVRDPSSMPKVLDEFQNIEQLTVSIKQTVGKTKINLSELNQFVKDPLDTYLKKKLGMYLTEEAEKEKEEIFHLDSLRRSILQKKVYLTIFENLPSAKKKWDRKNIERILDPIIETEIQNARFPNKVYSKLEKENILSHFEEREVLFHEWSNLLYDAKYHRYVSFGNTGLNSITCRKFPALQFETLPNVLLYHECEHVYEKNGIYYLIYTNQLESDIEPYTEFSTYKDYFGKMSHPFLHWAAFTAGGLSLKILTTNMKAKDNSLTGSLHFHTENESVQTRIYLEELIRSFTREKPQFFPRILYLNFFHENFNKTKSEEFRKDILLEKEEEWLQFQNEEIDDLYDNLSSVSKLYPKTFEYLFQPNIDFANRFYAPISLWREK